MLFRRIIRLVKTIKYLSKVKKYSRRFKSCGSNLAVFGSPYITAGKSISVGNNVFINNAVELNATCSKITIGNNVTISADAKILASTYDPSLFINEGKRTHIEKEVVIGDNIWIGAAAIICPGVKLTGKNVIIGAGSVVTKCFNESNVVIAGNPAKIVKRYNS